MFCSKCGAQLSDDAVFCSKCGNQINGKTTDTPVAPATAPATPINPADQPKDKMTTLLLCLFLGNLGVHRFYVGKNDSGIGMLLTGGGCGIWTLIDFISIITDKFTDAQGRIIGDPNAPVVTPAAPQQQQQQQQQKTSTTFGSLALLLVIASLLSQVLAFIWITNDYYHPILPLILSPIVRIVSTILILVLSVVALISERNKTMPIIAIIMSLVLPFVLGIVIGGLRCF